MSGTHSTIERLPRPEVRLTPLSRPAWIEVDLGIIAANVRVLRSIAGPGVRIGAVVKADAYGQGVEMVWRAARAGGATWMSVATIDEGLALRADGCPTRILVNYPLPAEALREAAAADLDVTAGSESDVRAITGLGPAAPVVHVEVETGMGRGGFAPSALVAATERLEQSGARVVGAWSHLAAAEDADRTRHQSLAFEAALATIRADPRRELLAHLCASGGLLVGAPRHDLVRLGLALYGHVPSDLTNVAPEASGLRPALSVRARSVRIIDVEIGTAIGYGGTWVAERPSRIATLPIGYVDGWLRAAGPRTTVLVCGRAVPVVGRISSDALTVDVTDVAGVDEASEFVLLGSQGEASLSAETVAERRETIVWEVLKTLAHRLPRRYLVGGRLVAERTIGAPSIRQVPGLEDLLAR